MKTLFSLQLMPHAKQRGSILLIALVLLLIITLLGISAVELTEAEIKIVKNTKNYNLAFQAAETGVIKAVDFFGGNLTPIVFQEKINNFGAADDDFVSPIQITDSDDETIAHTLVSIKFIENNDPTGNSYIIIYSLGRSGDIGDIDTAETMLVQTMLVSPELITP
jgi:hypothetical protein